jgi:hypothetical protein
LERPGIPGSVFGHVADDAVGGRDNEAARGVYQRATTELGRLGYVVVDGEQTSLPTKLSRCRGFAPDDRLLGLLDVQRAS